MNKSKRAFLKAGAALLASASLVPMQAFAFGSEAIRVMVTVEGGKSGNLKREFKVSKDAQHKLCETETRERAAILTEAVLDGIKNEFRGEPWLKNLPETAGKLQSQIEKALKDAGADTGEPKPGEIIITFTIGDVTITIRIDW